MKITLENLDGLPKELTTQNEKDGGKYVTKVEGGYEVQFGDLYEATTHGLRSALQQERGIKEAWQKLGKSPEDVQASIADLQAKKPQGKTDEDVAAMIEQATKPYQDKLDATTGQLSELREQNVTTTLQAELAKAGVLTDMVDMVATHAKARIIHAEDGSMQIRAVDGMPLHGTGENYTATISDLVADVVKSTPSVVKDGGKSGGGTPPNGGGTPPKSHLSTIEGFDALPKS